MRPANLVLLAMCVIGVVDRTTAYSAEVEAGIYRITSDGQGVEAARTVGGTVDLGERLATNLGDSTIWSLTNRNDYYRVMVKLAAPLERQHRLAICVDGVCEVVGSISAPDADGKVAVLADVVGQANARQVAVALNAKIQDRQHPGHQLRVSFSTVRESHRIGEPVVLSLRIVNVGKTTVRFLEGGQQRGPRNNQFGFTAFAGHGSGKSISDTGDPRHRGGIGVYRELKPGDVFDKQVDISKWFKFEKADTYQVTGTYELELRDKDYSARIIWKEFVTERCRVRIEK